MSTETCYLDILILNCDLKSMFGLILELWVNPIHLLFEISSIILWLLDESLGLQISKSGLLPMNEWLEVS